VVYDSHYVAKIMIQQKPPTSDSLGKDHPLNSPRQLKLNTLWGMGRSVTGALLFAASYPLYIHYLGLEVFGIWVMLMAIVITLQLGAIKLPEAATKFISEALMQQDNLRIRQYSSSLLVAVLFLGLGLVLIISQGREFIGGFFHAATVDPRQFPLLIVYAGLITFMAMVAETIAGIVSGSGRMDWAFMAEIFGRLVIFAVSVLLLFKQFGLMSLFYASFAGYAVYICLGLFFMRRSLGFFPLGLRHFSWQHLRQMTRFSLPLLSGSLCYSFLGPFNRLLLGLMISPAAASIYEIADRGAMLINAQAHFALRPLLPKVSGLMALADYEQISQLCLNTVRFIITWATPLFFILFVAVDYVVPLWLHTERNAEIVFNLRILLVGNYALLIRNPFFYTFMGMGRVSYCFYSDMIAPLVNVVVGILGILLWRQLWVLSLAATLGLIIASLLMAWFFCGNWRAMLSMLLKGVPMVGIPALAFAPLLFIQANLWLFIGLSGTIYFLYVFSIQYYRKAKICR
jgi:O-antigen/teichoic acid export membrane protein